MKNKVPEKMNIKNSLELIREEFIQNYLQYRWLDETRTKYIDRYFILLVALFTARIGLEITRNFSAKWVFILMMYVIFGSVLIFFARAIITYRRQQRGHGHFIQSLRLPLVKELINNPELYEWKVDRHHLCLYYKYIDDELGKPHFLTKWIELVIVIISSLVPFCLIDIIIHSPLLKIPLLKCIYAKCLLFIVLFSVALFVIFKYLKPFLYIPWREYNNPEKI